MIEDKQITSTFECVCPGLCPHNPHSYYKEHTGLGLQCCKKLSVVDTIRNKKIYDERKSAKHLNEQLQHIKHYHTRYVNKLNLPLVNMKLEVTLNYKKYTNLVKVCSRGKCEVWCPGCNLECVEPLQFAEWVQRYAAEMPFYYCRMCKLVFSFAKHIDSSMFGSGCDMYCPILIEKFTYRDVTVSKMPLFESEAQCQYWMPRIKIVFKQFCVDKCPNTSRNTGFIFTLNPNPNPNCLW